MKEENKQSHIEQEGENSPRKGSLLTKLYQVFKKAGRREKRDSISQEEQAPSSIEEKVKSEESYSSYYPKYIYDYYHYRMGDYPYRDEPWW